MPCYEHGVSIIVGVGPDYWQRSRVGYERGSDVLGFSKAISIGDEPSLPTVLANLTRQTTALLLQMNQTTLDAGTRARIQMALLHLDQFRNQLGIGRFAEARGTMELLQADFRALASHFADLARAGVLAGGLSGRFNAIITDAAWQGAMSIDPSKWAGSPSFITAMIIGLVVLLSVMIIVVKVF